ESLESKTRKAASDTAALARGAATAKVKEVQKGVGGTWDKLEQVFERRVERALSKLGVYTQNDVERLAQRVDVLSEAVNELIKATGVKPKRHPVPPAPAVKRTVKGAATSAAGAMPSAARTAKKSARSAKKTVRSASRALHK
ncbi:MAG TPA: phasin family protein, partial [Casimicrobiaceae bacterium]